MEEKNKMRQVIRLAWSLYGINKGIVDFETCLRTAWNYFNGQKREARNETVQD